MVDNDNISRQSGLQPNAEMSVIGFIVAAGSLLLFLPVAPFIALFWLFDRLTGRDAGDRAEDRTEQHLDEADERTESTRSVEA
jgi:hypothetical protein